ncbi:MAG: FAD-dependent oxidoreductase [Hyphomicrobiaceae bacterium]
MSVIEATRPDVAAETQAAIPRVTCDLLIAGSGASGMTAAIVAASHGLDVVVAEKEAVFGGTTAISGGYLWVPNNPASIEAGVKDTVDAAKTYMRHEAGNQFDEARVDAFLAAGPRMIQFMHDKTQVHFTATPAFCDYHPSAPGGTEGGRSILTDPVNASIMGEDLPKLRRQRQELTLYGLAIGSGKELWHFYRATERLESALYVAKRLAGHALDVARHGRGMTLTNGNALAARLWRSAKDRNVTIWLDSPVRRINKDADGKVIGAIVQTPQGVREIVARRGVILACGGFPQDVTRRAQIYGHNAGESEHWSAASPGNTGDGMKLGEQAGARAIEGYPNAAAWAPTSLVVRKDGTKAPFPHFIDRGKPGVIAVTRSGRRFVNEANCYHDFVQAMVKACPQGQAAEAFLLVDHKTLRKYGLGFVKPSPIPYKSQIKSGYLIKGDTIAELAKSAGIDAATLDATIAAWNADVPGGVDRAFGKGSTAYNRFHGDPEVKPNPCMRPVADGPFYVVRVVPGDIGTFAGLRTDEHARALDDTGAPIPGLYAVGNDMASILGGNYSGGGITLGPGMTFGYIAGKHAAGVGE